MATFPVRDESYIHRPKEKQMKRLAYRALCLAWPCPGCHRLQFGPGRCPRVHPAR